MFGDSWSHRGKRSLLQICRGLRRDNSGATAIEFSLVALPFFALMFAIIETAFVFFTQQYLDTAVQDAGRKLWTGEISVKNTTKEQFKKLICDNIIALFDCQKDLQVDVRSQDNWSTKLEYPIKDGVFDTSDFDFKTSGSNKIVLVRAAFVHYPFSQFFSTNNVRLSDGGQVILSAMALRPEPVDGESNFRSETLGGR